nr:MAG TPA: hypothetical protein [Caudoviricetes sp.]
MSFFITSDVFYVFLIYNYIVIHKSRFVNSFL